MKKHLLLLVALCFCASSLVFAGPYGPGAPSKKNPPKKAGEYRIKDTEGKTKYVGETKDLDRRKKEHGRSGKIGPGDSFQFKPAKPDATAEERRQHEKDKIKQHQPYDNKSAGGEGRK